MREVAAMELEQSFRERMDVKRTVHGRLVEGNGLVIRLGMKLVMLGGILPSCWRRRDLSAATSASLHLGIT
jgi:hypothetical protein